MRVEINLDAHVVHDILGFRMYRVQVVCLVKGSHPGFPVGGPFADDMPEASVRFALSNQGVSTVLVGYSDLDHLEKAVRYAAEGPLPAEALARLPQVWSTYVG